MNTAEILQVIAIGIILWLIGVFIYKSSIEKR